jgi:hypothetical protein
LKNRNKNGEKGRQGTRYGRRAWVQGGIITLLAFLASISMGASIIGQTLGRLTLDQLILLDRPVDEDQIVLIDITEKDYTDIFYRKRPLDPKTIVNLITAAHMAGAKLIAVDISTADWPPNWQTPKTMLPSGAAIVWARSFYRDIHQPHAQYSLESLLGGVDPNQHCYGVPRLGEEGGVVRTFYSGMQISGKSEPSFINQIVYRSSHKSCLTEDPADEKMSIIAFSSKMHVESASTLLKQFEQKDWDGHTIYGGKIVILGGSFHSGSDILDTPKGVESGLEVTGQAVSSAIRNNARTQLGEWSSIWIDLGFGILLLLAGIFGRFVQGWVTFASLVLLGIVSVIAFRQYYLFVSFLPFVVGIMVHVILEGMHNREARQIPAGAPVPDHVPKA